MIIDAKDYDKLNGNIFIDANILLIEIYNQFNNNNMFC